MIKSITQNLVLIACAIVLAVGLVYVGKSMYVLAGKTTSEFYAKSGDLILQLAFIVIVGAVIKALVDWAVSLGAYDEQRNEARLDFMRRVRGAHITTEYARQLLNAHESAKTYGEQLRRLMQLRFEVEEISEDLKASSLLFAEQTNICKGLEGIVDYLEEGRDEYVRCHGHVDSDWKKKKQLRETMTEQSMYWVEDLMSSGTNFKEKYIPNLTFVKKSMRDQIYGT